MTKFELETKINELRNAIDNSFQNSREKSLILTKLDEANLWLTRIDVDMMKGVDKNG